MHRSVPVRLRAAAILGLAAAAISPAPAQTAVLSPEGNTLQIDVQGITPHEPVMLAGYVSVEGTTTVGVPPQGALTAAALSPFLDPIDIDGSEYHELTAIGRVFQVQLTGSSFQVPHYAVARAIEDFHELRTASGYQHAVDQITQTTASSTGSFSWSSAPPLWTASASRTIQWLHLGYPGQQATLLGLESVIRAFVAQQFTYEPNEGSPSNPVGMYHPNVDAVIDEIRAQNSRFYLHVQVMTFAASGGGPPILRIRPTATREITLPDDPSGLPLRLVQEAVDPYLYPAMAGVPFDLELEEPLTAEQIANLRIAFPANNAAGQIVVGEVAAGIGPSWIRCGVPPAAINGRLRAFDQRFPNALHRMAKPYEASPGDHVTFEKHEPPSSGG